MSKKSNRTKYTVLGMLALGDHTGYEIVKMLKASVNYFWSESEGQIYPTLAQCVTEGLTTCQEVKSKKSNRDKKIYSITSKGKKELKSWLKKEPHTEMIRNELLLKLFFGRNTEIKDNIHHLVKAQKEVETEIDTFLKIREALVKEHKKSPHLKYWLITLDFGIRTAKAQLTWCKESLKILNENRSKNVN